MNIKYFLYLCEHTWSSEENAWCPALIIPLRQGFCFFLSLELSGWTANPSDLFPARIPQNTEVTGAHMFMPGFLPYFWIPDSGPQTRTQLLLGVTHLQITSPPPFCSVFTFCLYICFAFGFLICLFVVFSPRLAWNSFSRHS